MKNPLDTYGEFVMRNLRDRVIDDANSLIDGVGKAPSRQSLQRRLADLDEEQKSLVLDVVTRSVTSGIHDYLFALQNAPDDDLDLEVQISGKNIADMSDGLQGEMFSESGWISRYSKYPEDDQA